MTSKSWLLLAAAITVTTAGITCLKVYFPLQLWVGVPLGAICGAMVAALDD